MAGIHITDIEAAINYWRERKPSPDGVTLAPELRALAQVYALMVFHHEDEAAEARLPAGRLCRLEGLVRNDAGHALHRHLFYQPGRRAVQGVRAQLRGSAALDRDVARGKARHLAPHHLAGRCLAFQQVRRARRRSAGPGAVDLSPVPCCD